MAKQKIVKMRVALYVQELGEDGKPNNEEEVVAWEEDLTGYDLTKPLARASLVNDLTDVVSRFEVVPAQFNH